MASDGSNGSATAVGDNEEASQVATLGDSCLWATAAQSCMAPRSCHDCLNVDVADDKCAIDSQGVCVSIYDLTLAEVATGSYYASDDFDYCGSDDADCAACRSTWEGDYRRTGVLSTSAECVTASGCVCLWSCVEPSRHDSIVNAFCSALGSRQLLMFSGLALGMFLFFVVLALVLRVYLRQYLAREEEEQRELRRRRRRGPRREPKGPLLQLSAWNSMLDKLIESEQGNADEAKPRLERQPSAPAVVATRSPPPSHAVEMA